LSRGPRPPRGKPTRLDLLLVARGLAETRQQAQALVMAGRVRVGARPATKPGTPVGPSAAVEVLAGPQHVGRGALKLEGALDELGLDPAGLVALDVGASTGGFTQALLSRGARRVYAVDVGRAQLHETLRADPRVVALERTNARRLSAEQVPESCGFAAVDVSFISVLKILPALRPLLAADAQLAVLVKPQFELGRGRVGRGGVVRDAADHRAALERVARGAAALGYGVAGACASRLRGAEGNREFFLHLRRDGVALAPEAFSAMMARALA
jgi:23S rRNA (cytidine1920-2'-O)/16S rRNA (cytidine1409-2'-O)-methyltransferase